MRGFPHAPLCLALALFVAAMPLGRARAAAPEDTEVCLDAEVTANLTAKRKRRSVKERLVQKTNRHEFILRGGHYVSDLFDGTWLAGGAYRFHLTEGFAVEASAAYTRITSRAVTELERFYTVLQRRDRQSLLFATNLVLTVLHGKMQSGGGIVHFDVSATAGAGVVDSDISSGIAANAGLGFAFFVNRAFTVHVDVRDYVFRQQLLARQVLVNDLAVTLGLGVLFPFVE